MKFKVTMKDPDTLGDALNMAIATELELRQELDDSEREVLFDGHFEKNYDVCKKWFEYGEYLTVEIDTEAKTCVVVERGQ